MVKLKFSLIVFLFLSCNTSSRVDVAELNLQESFEQKDDQQFLEEFPKNFEQFHILFGWDTELDKPGELYTEYEEYIDRWFSLLSSDKNANNEKYIVEICKGAQWEPKGIDYFQDCTIEHIKKNRKYHILNDLNHADAHLVILFLFHSSGSTYDEEFASNLDPTKKEMMRSLFLPFEGEVISNDDTNIVETYSVDLDGDKITDQISVVRNKDIEDKYDRDHFGLQIELRKGRGNDFTKWKSNTKLIAQPQTSCISNGFDGISIGENEFTIIQQTCYDYTILVTSYASFNFKNGEVYLSEYREEFFDKANHEAEIPSESWTPSDFGKLKFEDVTIDLIKK